MFARELTNANDQEDLDCVKKERPMTKMQKFTGIRMPKDNLAYYLKMSTRVTFVHNNSGGITIRALTLIRAKYSLAGINYRDSGLKQSNEHVSKMGCVLKREFYIKDAKNPEKVDKDLMFKCRVYRRIRYDTDDQGQHLAEGRKVYDWKVKVMQMQEPFSLDYIVVKRLPCKLKYIESHLQ